jgi:hypothetical protein
METLPGIHPSTAHIRMAVQVNMSTYMLNTGSIDTRGLLYIKLIDIRRVVHPKVGMSFTVDTIKQVCVWLENSQMKPESPFTLTSRYTITQIYVHEDDAQRVQ